MRRVLFSGQYEVRDGSVTTSRTSLHVGDGVATFGGEPDQLTTEMRTFLVGKGFSPDPYHGTIRSRCVFYPESDIPFMGHMENRRWRNRNADTWPGYPCWR